MYDDLMDSAGTDPATSNDLASIVIDVHNQVHPGEYVDLALRYGIAHAVQRAGYVKVDAIEQANHRIKELEDKLWAAERRYHQFDEWESEPEDA